MTGGCKSRRKAPKHLYGCSLDAGLESLTLGTRGGAHPSPEIPSDPLAEVEFICSPVLNQTCQGEGARFSRQLQRSVKTLAQMAAESLRVGGTPGPA